MDLEECHGDGRQEVRKLLERSVWRGLLVDEQTCDGVFPVGRLGQCFCILQRRRVHLLSRLLYRSYVGEIT